MTMRRGLLLGLLALPGAARAGSQSSNSSSNCSNGRCTERGSFVVEDQRGRRGWVREEHWREESPRRYRERDRRHADAWWDSRYPPRRHRRDDDDN
ncbi:hypothetical protein [Sabulicella rubraurantiaca]|uniref:hypothetical protein n=1 Tax=Sabulicella rubraurantiaca TaxID=2811429 RepID=UPI001A96B386|nr:hypothetical protein [Sabulicella rubraurantiaca]